MILLGVFRLFSPGAGETSDVLLVADTQTRAGAAVAQAPQVGVVKTVRAVYQTVKKTCRTTVGSSLDTESGDQTVHGSAFRQPASLPSDVDDAAGRPLPAGIPRNAGASR